MVQEHFRVNPLPSDVLHERYETIVVEGLCLLIQKLKCPTYQFTGKQR